MILKKGTKVTFIRTPKLDKQGRAGKTTIVYPNGETDTVAYIYTEEEKTKFNKMVVVKFTNGKELYFDHNYRIDDLNESFKDMEKVASVVTKKDCVQFIEEYSDEGKQFKFDLVETLGVIQYDTDLNKDGLKIKLDIDGIYSTPIKSYKFDELAHEISLITESDTHYLIKIVKYPNKDDVKEVMMLNDREAIILN